MTDYNDKAQRIVALGIGAFKELPHRFEFGELRTKSAYKFCNDWRVVGALLEKCYDIGCDIAPDCDAQEVEGIWSSKLSTQRQAIMVPIKDSLREAIVDACLEALENDTNP